MTDDPTAGRESLLEALPDVSFNYVDTRWFSPVTRPWIKALAEALDGSPSGDSILSIGTAAQMFFLFRALPEEAFPGGKSATIQHLADQIEKVIAAGLEQADV